MLDEWGFTDWTSPWLGTTVLFVGPSGTGKTLATAKITHDLDFDLVRVDLSQVVSKCIGETKKNLRPVFDAGEDGGCVQLFEETDALFGPGWKVRDSHDRCADFEIGCLLERMQEFRGLAVLTTNAQPSLDQPFGQRLSTIITIAYFDAVLREALWHAMSPAATRPRGLGQRRLDAVDLPGDGIAAAALTAPYLGAAADEAVTAEHIRTATRWELA